MLLITLLNVLNLIFSFAVAFVLNFARKENRNQLRDLHIYFQRRAFCSLYYLYVKRYIVNFIDFPFLICNDSSTFSTALIQSTWEPTSACLHNKLCR